MSQNSKISIFLRRHQFIGVVGALFYMLCSLCPRLAHAEEIPEHFTPIAPMGMGNASTAIASDEESIWTNPAGIARARKARSRSTLNMLKFPNIFLGVNNDGRAFYQAVKSAGGESVEGIVADAGDLANKPLWIRAGAFPVALFDFDRNTPGAIGAYSNTVTKAIVEKETPTEARVSMISDAGAVFTYGYSTTANRFNIGLQARPVYRYAFESSIPSAELVDRAAVQKRFQSGANKSTGLGLDAGMMMTLADFWFPTLGLSVLNLPTGCKSDYLNPFTEQRQNICGTLYTGKLANPDALSAVDPMDMRAGVAISPRLSRKITMRFALDLHHMYTGSDAAYYGLPGIDTGKQLHAGVELYIGNPLDQTPFSIRAGSNQGFATFGVTGRLGFLSIDIATYGVDTSSTPTRKEDRRSVMSLTAVF